MYLVITDRLRPLALSAPALFWDCQARFDAWLQAQGAAFRSLRHFLTLIGEPLLETWLEYADLADLHRDQVLLHALEKTPAYQQHLQELYRYLERLGSRLVEEVPPPATPPPAEQHAPI